MYCRLTRGCYAGEGDVGEASRFAPLRTEQTETLALTLIPPGQWPTPRSLPSFGSIAAVGAAGIGRAIGSYCVERTDMTYLDRITFNSQQCGGRPCVRGMRIRVKDVLDLLAAGLSEEEILGDYPDLESEDIRACLQYAAAKRAMQF